MAKYELRYQIFKTLIRPLVLLKYCPTIEGEQFLPKNGPVIFCGSHKHIHDQVPVIDSTHHFIHWLAKQEYFDKITTSVLYRNIGCIPVDRYGNSKRSKEVAIECLNRGESIGIFPEGTRNRLSESQIQKIHQQYYGDKLSLEDFAMKIKSQKPRTSQYQLLLKLYEERKISLHTFEEGLFYIKNTLEEATKKGLISYQELNDSLLLPFFPGAVSMAQQTGAVLQPFSVVGDWSIRKGITLKYGESFSVPKDDSVIDANKKLRGKILELEK